MSPRHPIAKSWRLLRMVAHLLRGLWITQRQFDHISEAAKATHIKRWSQQLLEICDISLVASHDTITSPALVSNHITWLDIFAINAVQPVAFIAKQEIQSWPLVGTLLTRVGTQFINRNNRRDITRVNEILADCIRQGKPLAFFPEGTTSDGLVLKPFKSSLFQPLIDAGIHCQVVSIQYQTAAGDYAAPLAFVGDLTFMGSLWQTLGQRGTRVVLQVLPALDCAGADRRSLSVAALGAIEGSLRAPTN
jgi:1-acyl-sn-glycerol-3-phosphate acyltransferase